MYLHRPLLFVIAAFAVCLGVSQFSSLSHAQGGNGLDKDVIEIAEALKKGDGDKAKKQAEALAAKVKTSDLMELHRTRKNGGMGFGSVVARNPATDGFEKKLREFEKAIPATFAKEYANYEEAGYWMAALAEATLAKGPEKKTAANVKAWEQWSKDMRDASIAFAKASADKDAKAVKLAADKISSTCSSCHTKFKKK